MRKLLLIISIFLYTNANEIELSGTIISDNEKIISSRNMGYIKNVYVEEGTFVKKGQLLYEIDSSNIDSLKQEALLNLEIQKNILNNIQTNYDRYKRLYSQDLVPKYDVEKLELNLLNVKNMIAIAKSKLKEVNQQYAYLKIKAPNDGLIIKKSIKTGEMAIPGTPALILSDLSSLKIKTEIAESNLNSIKLGHDVNIEIPSINYKTTGKISAIIPSVHEMSHSFTIKISFYTNKQQLYPGMYSKLLIKPLEKDKK